MWYPKENKLEIFARTRIEGWDTFGNEVPVDVEIETPKNDRKLSFDNF